MHRISRHRISGRPCHIYAHVGIPDWDIPKIATIASPTFPGIVAPPIKVAMDAPGSALSTELSTANIEYLSKVCTFLVPGAAGDQQRVEKKQQVKQKRVENKQRSEKKQRVEKNRKQDLTQQRVEQKQQVKQKRVQKKQRAEKKHRVKQKSKEDLQIQENGRRDLTSFLFTGAQESTRQKVVAMLFNKNQNHSAENDSAHIQNDSAHIEQGREVSELTGAQVGSHDRDRCASALLVRCVQPNFVIG